MRKLSLKEIQHIEFGILEHFDAFCKEKDIKYFISNGTLLGAIKYKKFIPWDDDIDVFVPREDYERLIKEYHSNDNMKLICDKNHTNYLLPFSKLCDTSTVIRDQAAKQEFSYGLHIDIFPLDCWTNDYASSVRQASVLKMLVHILSFSISPFEKETTFFRTFIKNTLIALARAVGSVRIKKILGARIKKIITGSGDEYCGCVVWPVYGKKEVIPCNVFSNTKLVEFEGKMFPAPSGYEFYLSSLYGNYAKDPPLDKQKSHHKFTAYKL